jgi:hypothetical protein
LLFFHHYNIKPMRVLFFTFSCFLLGMSSVYSQLLSDPTQLAPAYGHLCEVNKQWLVQAPPNGMTAEMRFISDVDRIQYHLQQVETALRERPAAGEHPQRTARRTAALDALKGYWQAAQFPLNEHHSTRVPVFVDDHNTACAVGYLLLATGEEDLVGRIRKADNYASIEELLVYPALRAWANEHGFTTDELAWIQPDYGVLYFTPRVFGNNLGLEGGPVKDMKVVNDELYFAGYFTRIDGFEASALAAWDGAGFRAFPGLTGGIDRLEIDSSTQTIYALGAFTNFTDEPGHVLMAQYVDGTWLPMLNSTQVRAGDTTGLLTDFICFDNDCYLSGDFTHIDGQPIAHLARYDKLNGTWDAYSDVLAFSDRITDMDKLASTLLLGGKFALLSGADTLAQYVVSLDMVADTVIPAASIVGQIDFYETGLPIIIQDVLHVSRIEHSWGRENMIVTATEFGHFVWRATPYQWPWELYPLEEPDTATSTINGILGHYAIFGSMRYDWDTNAQPYVLTAVPGQSASPYWPLVRANGQVTAVARYHQDDIFVGEFTEIQGVAIQHITSATLLITDTENLAPAVPLSVGTDGAVLFINHIPFSEQPMHLELFDMAGRLSWTYQLPVATDALIVPVPNLPAGAYAYRVYNESLLGSGQIVLVNQRR